jgi:hypothetical protein
MRITFQLSVMVGLLLCGCSEHNNAASTAVVTGRPVDHLTYSDGTTLDVRERKGDELFGFRMIRKSPDGQESYVSERGKIAEEPGGIVRVTLYEAQVDRGSRGRMTVQELSVRLMK